MPDTITRPGNHNGDAFAARDRLRQAIAELTRERARHDHFLNAQTRVQDDLRQANSALLDAQDALAKARRKQPADLAWNYANGQETLTLRHGIAEVSALVERRNAEVQHYRDVSDALEREIEQVEVRLRNCQSAVHEALARVVATSPELQAFLQDLAATWKKLRTLKETGGHILEQCHGYLDAAVYRAIQAAEPLERRVGYDIDDAYFDRWSGALARLLEHADTALPDGA
jgi:chromosome segregation ATPase